jgi:hypothetical protein
MNHNGESGSAVRLLAKSRAGERAGSEDGRGDSARLRSARESSTESKVISRLFEVRWFVNFDREGKHSELIEAGGEASRWTIDSSRSG